MKYFNNYNIYVFVSLCALLQTNLQQAGISYELSRPNVIGAERHRIIGRANNSIFVKDGSNTYYELRYSKTTKTLIRHNWQCPVSLYDNRDDDRLEQLYPSNYIYLVTSQEADALWLRTQLRQNNIGQLINLTRSKPHSSSNTSKTSSNTSETSSIRLSSQSRYSKSSNAEEASDVQSSSRVSLIRKNAIRIKKRSRSESSSTETNSTQSSSLITKSDEKLSTQEPQTQPKVIWSSLASTVIVDVD